MQNFSFDFQDPFFEFKGLHWGFRVFTIQNTYGPDPDKIEIHKTSKRLRIEAQGFFWAGRQKKGPGWLLANLNRNGNTIEWWVEAEHSEPIKGIGTLIKGLKPGKVLNSVWEFEELNVGTARIFAYPSCPWLSWTAVGPLPTPLFFIQHEGNRKYTFAWSLDDKVRPKRFVVSCESEEELIMELHHEEDARKFETHITTPLWRMGQCDECGTIVKDRMRLMEKRWGLKPWEERPDVPEWARKIALVVNLHGAHWTGFVFNTFERQLEILKWLNKRINGQHILAFLAGWDGRYYYKYPRYEADPDLGGSQGLKRLVDGAHNMGIHVIPMFGAVAVSVQFMKKLGMEDAMVRDKYGNTLISNWVDWDNDRDRDNIWFPTNLGHPKFQEYMFNRICRTVDNFGVDGAFLDISHFWENDPNYSFFEGMRSLAQRLHERYKDFLIFGESWYDALLGVTPIVHAHTYLPRQWPEFFQKYARMTYHLSWPAPGRGSSGVHELGFSSFQVPDPNRDIIVTLSIVNDTLPDHAKEVEQTIVSAKAYARRKGFLT
jgi:hypothetical protein